jgi:hypothetical protein
MGVTIVGKEGLTTSLSDKDGKGILVPLLRSQGDSILGYNVWRLVLFQHGIQEANRFACFIHQPNTASSTSQEKPMSWLPFVINQGGIKSWESKS